MLLGDPGAAIGYLEERARDSAHAPVADLDALRAVIPDRVLERVLTEVPDDLPQLVRIGPHLQLLSRKSSTRRL